jgi:ankyrin repeat protein
MVQLLLEWGADVNAWDLRGNTPLHNCVKDCTYEDFDQALKIAKILPEAGAEVDSKPFKPQYEWDRVGTVVTPLLLAAKGPWESYSPENEHLDPEQLPRSRTEMQVKLLRRYGADVHAKDWDGNSALVICVCDIKERLMSVCR